MYTTRSFRASITSTPFWRVVVPRQRPLLGSSSRSLMGSSVGGGGADAAYSTSDGTGVGRRRGGRVADPVELRRTRAGGTPPRALLTCRKTLTGGLWSLAGGRVGVGRRGGKVPSSARRYGCG